MQMQQQIPAATVQHTSHQVRHFADLCVQRAENPFLPARNIHTPLSIRSRLWSVMNVTILAS
jgi:hypothetical protein